MGGQWWAWVGDFFGHVGAQVVHGLVLVSLHWWVGVPSQCLVNSHCLASSGLGSGGWVCVGCFRWVWHLQVVQCILHVVLH